MPADETSASTPPPAWADVVLMSDAAVTGIPVREHDTADGTAAAALVDSTGLLGWSGPSTDPVSRWLRRPVLERLQDAAAALPGDLRLALNEGYRRPAVQRQYFESYAARLRRLDPRRDAAEIHRLASRFVSPPEVGPHTAGSAADVVLTTPEGEVLDVGCPIDANPEESEGRCYTRHPDVTGEALLLRRELVAALAGAGLVNYPTEWWHWSFGDRYWALATGRSHALFGTVEPPSPRGATGP